MCCTRDARGLCVAVLIQGSAAIKIQDDGSYVQVNEVC